MQHARKSDHRQHRSTNNVIQGSDFFKKVQHGIERVQDGRDLAQNLLTQGQKSARRIVKATETRVKKYPLLAVGAAAVAGYVFAKLFSSTGEE